MTTHFPLHFVFFHLDMSYSTSPTGPLRKHLSTGTAGLGLGSGNTDRGRSLSPLPMAVPVKGKSSAVPANGSAVGSKMLGEGLSLYTFYLYEYMLWRLLRCLCDTVYPLSCVFCYYWKLKTNTKYVSF